MTWEKLITQTGIYPNLVEHYEERYEATFLKRCTPAGVGAAAGG